MALWPRIFASFYDPMMARADDAGVRAHRQAVAREAAGRVLEIGAGTGRNLAFYTDAVTELVLTEPEAAMAQHITGHTVISAGAEALPFEDASFDTVVSTLVLCTVPDLVASLREVRRVLRPDGSLLFLEHVRAEEPGLARWQDRLHGPWLAFGNGCHCNRDTVAAITAAGFSVDALERQLIPELLLARPIVRGRARPVALA